MKNKRKQVHQLKKIESSLIKRKIKGTLNKPTKENNNDLMTQPRRTISIQKINLSSKSNNIKEGKNKLISSMIIMQDQMNSKINKEWNERIIHSGTKIDLIELNTNQIKITKKGIRRMKMIKFK